MDRQAVPELLGIPGPVLRATASIVAQLTDVAHALGTTVSLDAESILCHRAHLLSLERPGSISANGHSRLVPCTDGWLALTLARPDDVGAVEALTGIAVTGDPWEVVQAAGRCRRTDELVAQGRLLGLAIAPLPRTPPAGRPAVRRSRGVPRRDRPDIRGLRVLDLSSLWAGPLAARILMQAGATVTKVESVARPDGARRTPAFYETLHPRGQAEFVVDLGAASGRDALRAELESADVVIEGSRPRALEQLGLDADRVRPPSGGIWASLTGYGRPAPGRDWVAFGDDAAVAGGLVGSDVGGAPRFVGDAIADPLTGLFAALAILEAVRDGGGTFLDISMQRSAATVATAGADRPLVDSRA